ncbi:putative baseplate assembly protein [Paenibacillus sp. TRM 82003]|nr:putative baseplate assembly protein [Paenibacillus sp. TRM 82003]
MLPLPNLDDRTFEQLVREARDMIPGLLPEWTDENTHDPGITLLEMLAWHLEVQQFQLDRMTERHERKFLKLLGERPRDLTPSRTSVVFTGASAALALPLGTPLRAGELPFETEERLAVVPNAGMRVSVTTSSGNREATAGDDSDHAPFYPFGPDGERGARMIVRSPLPLPADLPLSIWIELAAEGAAGDEPMRIPPDYPAFVPSGKTEWQYWHEAEDGTAEWTPLPDVRDETHAFHQSGSIRFRLPRPSRRLSVVMKEGAYDRVPRIGRLAWNEVPVVQGETRGVVESFDGDGMPGLSLRPAHALFGAGLVRVQVRDDEGWTDWEEVWEWPSAPLPVFRTTRDANGLVIAFGDGEAGGIPAAGADRIRVYAMRPEDEARFTLGAGTSVSGQRFELPLTSILPETLRVQVGWTIAGRSKPVWTDWERVDDFDRSTPDSLHFRLEDDAKTIRFGDGQRGAVPPAAGFPNVRIIACRAGGGEGGNVKEGQIRELSTDALGPELGEGVERLRLANLRPADCGAAAETTNDALRRLQRSVLEPDCGVTAEDLERLVRRIPGLRIARVKAIPGFRPGLAGYPVERAFGHVSVVVVPRAGGTGLPRPSAGLLRTVENHLEPYRLLTTKFHVIPPEYVKVTVRAIVVVDPRFDGRDRRVQEALEKLFQPYGDDAGAGGWEFGRSVYKGDVYDAIHQVPGVLYIQDVWLMADGKDVFKEEGGDVRIPPNALVVSGEHEIEFISSQR